MTRNNKMAWPLRGRAFVGAGLLALMTAGCAHYHLGSSVPPEKRTISVPVFVNASGQPEAEVLVTQAVLSEFRREGTMHIASHDTAALEVVGRVTGCTLTALRNDHDRPYIVVEYRMELTADVKVVERATGKVKANLGRVTGTDIFRTQSDLPSAKRDALPRAAHKLAQQIVLGTTSAWW